MSDHDDPSDDDLTPSRQRRPRSQWGDNERVAVGREHRGRDTDSERHRTPRQRLLSRPKGIPVLRDHDGFEEGEITPPIAMLLDRDQLDDYDRAMIQRLRQETDPAEQVYRLAKDAYRSRDRQRSQLKEQEIRLRELLDRPPKEVADRIVTEQAEIKRELTSVKHFTDSQRKILNWLGGGLIGAVLTVGGWLYHRGGVDEGTNLRLQQLERTVERLEHMIDRIDRRVDAPALPNIKGP